MFLVLIVFIFLLVIFFSVSFVTLSHVLINEYMTISGCVITIWVPYVVHVFEIIKLPRFENFLFFVFYNHGVVGPMFLVLIPIIFDDFVYPSCLGCSVLEIFLGSSL
jgi:hypothetical protein